MFGTAMYQQGAGLHTASNMFKNSVEFFNTGPLPHTCGPTAQSFMQWLFGWMENVWEHSVSHYMYAAGGIWVAIVQTYAYRNVLVREGLTSMVDRGLWLANAVVYGLLIGAVAVDFPSGSIVCLAFLLAYGAGVLGTFAVRSFWHDGTLLSWGKRYVVQYFLMSYMVALLIVIIWMSIYGTERRGAAGVV
jgi:hypothetical protein